METGCRECWKC